MAGVPFIFGNATTSIPLSNLDANFNTGVTIGNTTVGLGNTVTTLGNVTLNNANFGGVANAVIYTNSGGNVTSNASIFSVFASGGVSIGNITDPGAGNLRFNTTSTNGIYFGASSLLNDYESGTWTPTLTTALGSITSYTSSAYYKKVGGIVTVTGTLAITNNGTGAGGIIISGIPFLITNSLASGTAREGSVTGVLNTLSAQGSGAFIMYTYNNLYPAVTGSTFMFSVTYLN